MEKDVSLLHCCPLPPAPPGGGSVRERHYRSEREHAARHTLTSSASNGRRYVSPVSFRHPFCIFARLATSRRALPPLRKKLNVGSLTKRNSQPKTRIATGSVGPTRWRRTAAWQACRRLHSFASPATEFQFIAPASQIDDLKGLNLNIDIRALVLAAGCLESNTALGGSPPAHRALELLDKDPSSSPMPEPTIRKL